MDRLKGKRCLVTAAAQGIGRATALAFASEGADVLATDINEPELAALAASNRGISTARLDVTKSDEIARLCSGAQFDVVANIAGIVHNGSILDCPPKEWRRSFAVNVDSMYMICRAVVPGMVAAGGGSIVNMSSIASSVKGIPQRFAYCATKAAVIGLTKSIAADFVKQGIRCNAVCPGTVETPSLAERVTASNPDTEAAWQTFRDRQPMGRLGRAEEIANLFVYLASDESAFTTGAVHVIDGGWVN